MDDKPKKTTQPQLKKGINPRQAINPKAASNFSRKKRPTYTLEEYVEGILANDRVILGQAITLIESTAEQHKVLAEQIIERCLPHSGHSFRLGITGTPGVGKSTFIESFGVFLSGEALTIAALAVDPTSQITKGSILGDKTRMAELSATKTAFIRPSPAGDSLGGVARKTREAIILCEAAGYDFIIVETVGVGQSEVAVHSMVDFFLLLLLPGGGDELQGIKRGIVEMADLIVVNKADGERKLLARQTQRFYQNALHLFPLKENKWSPKVVQCSALEKNGFEKIYEIIGQYIQEMKSSSFFSNKRQQQAHFWLHESIRLALQKDFYSTLSIQEQLHKIESDVKKGVLSPFKAAQILLSSWKNKS